MLNWISAILVWTVVLAGPATIVYKVYLHPDKSTKDKAAQTQPAKGHASFTRDAIVQNGVTLRRA